MSKIKKIIHINQHKIKSNRKTGKCEPVITCKTYKENRYGHEVSILDDNGKEIATIRYRPNNPLPCGAHIWLETTSDVEVKEFKECP